MKITIKTLTMHKRYTYIIDSEKKVFEINSIPIDADPDQALFLINNLTSTWPKKLEDKNILDGYRCMITIENGQNKETFSFINQFPSDFYLLNDYLEEVKSGVSRVI